MCGITGIIKKKNLQELDVLKSIILSHQMSFRGGTSHGFGLIRSNAYEYYKEDIIKKSINNPEFSTNLLDSYKAYNCVFTHERNASVGMKNVPINTQPIIFDEENKEEDFIVLLHNGTIYNSDELLEKRKIKTPISASDSYALAALVATQDYSFLKEYVGTATIVWYYSKTQKFYFWTGSSLDEYNKLSPERPLFLHYKKGEQLIFSSTKNSLEFAGIDEKEVIILDENTLYSMDINSIELLELESFDRSLSKQKKTRYQGFKHGYGHNFRKYKNDEYESEDDIPYKNTKSKKKNNEILLNRGYLIGHTYSGTDHYFKNHYQFITESINPITKINGSILNTVKLNVFKGIYYFNGYPMHSVKLFKDLCEKKEEINTEYIPFHITKDGEVKEFATEFTTEAYFFKGRLCKHRDSLVKLNKLINTDFTILDSFMLSEFLTLPVDFYITKEGSKKSTHLFYNFKNLKDTTKEINIPFTDMSAAFSDKISITYQDLFSYYSNKLLNNYHKNTINLNHLYKITSIQIDCPLKKVIKDKLGKIDTRLELQNFITSIVNSY